MRRSNSTNQSRIIALTSINSSRTSLNSKAALSWNPSSPSATMRISDRSPSATPSKCRLISSAVSRFIGVSVIGPVVEIREGILRLSLAFEKVGNFPAQERQLGLDDVRI